MNLETIDWSMVIGVTTVVGFVYGCFRNLKSDIKEQHNRLEEHIHHIGDQVNEVRNDLGDFRDEVHSDSSDIKERISFLEAATLYTMPIETPQPNPRSAAAREMWQRRKAKRLEKKE